MLCDSFTFEHKLSHIYIWVPAEEKLTNPFMRVDQPSVQKHANLGEAVATMGFIRKEKDSFKA